MKQKKFIINDREFRTETDYKLGIRDQKTIEEIRINFDFTLKSDLFKLKKEIKNGKYKFYSIIGKDFYEEFEDVLNSFEEENKKSKSVIKIRNDAKTYRINQQIENKNINLDIVNNKKEVVDDEIEKLAIKELKKKEKHRKIIALLCCFIAICCFSYYFFYTYQEQRTRNSYHILANLVEKSTSVENNEFAYIPNSNYINTELIVPDILEEYLNAYNINKRLIGWIKFDDNSMNINYPVMKTDDNEYYLEHNINQESDRNGAIFMDKDCDILKPSTNWILYGHNMRSGQMFGSLDKYSDESYYKKYPTFQFDTIYEKGIYDIMFVFRSQIYNEGDIVFKYYQFIDALSEKEFNSYMEEMANISLYDTGVWAEYGDQLVTLSTCDNYRNDGRFVVVGKKRK